MPARSALHRRGAAVGATSFSSETPPSVWRLGPAYCDVFALLRHVGLERVRAVLRDAPGAPVLSYLDVGPSGNPVKDLLEAVGTSVTREVDEACRAGRVYRPADLLRPLPREPVERFVAHLWYWRCVERWEGYRAEPAREPEHGPHGQKPTRAKGRLAACAETPSLSGHRGGQTESDSGDRSVRLLGATASRCA
jgi:hypothetical protein